MASFLFPYQPVTYEPYHSPLELYQQALQYKDFKFAKGLANIRSHYDAVLNTPLTNEQDQLALRTGVNQAMDRLSKLAVGDVSLPENQASVNALFDGVLEDQDLLYDAAWTRNHQKQLKKAEDLQKTKPELVPPQNLHRLYKAQDAFRTAPKGGRPSPTKFSPYYDFDKIMTEALDKVKPEVDVLFSQKGVKIEGPDGQMYDVELPSQYTVEQLKSYTINKLVSQRLSSDPQALFQLQLDHEYNTDSGIYPPSAAIRGIDDELSLYRSASDAITLSINGNKNLEGGPLTANEKIKYQEQLKGIELETQKLKDLRGKVSANPAASNEWFTLDKHIRDYIGGKVTQYSYTKNSLLSGIPGVDEYNRYKYDVLKEGWKAKFDLEKEVAKAKAGVGANAKDALTIPTPWISLMDRLDSSPEGIPATNQEVSALGQMHVNPQTGGLYVSWSSKGTSPDNTLLFTLSSGNMTKEQINTIDSNIVLLKMDRELEDLGIQMPGLGGVTSVGPGVPVTAKTLYYSGEEILENYYKNPSAADRRVKGIVDKYNGFLKKNGIDVNNREQVLKVQGEMKNPEIEQAVTFGTTIDLNGRYEFVPTQGVNLVQGDNGKLYMKGKMIIPEREYKKYFDNKDLKKYSNILSTWDVIPSSGDSKDEKKQKEQTYGVEVHMPVNGDAVQINDRMLESQNYQQQFGQKAPTVRAESARQTTDYLQTLDRSRPLNSLNVNYNQDATGKYKLNINPLDDKQRNSATQIYQLASEASRITGKPLAQVYDDFDQIFGSNKTALQRQRAVEAYISSANFGPVDPKTVAGFMKGIAGPEGAGYDVQNKQGSSAFGKYQITEGTYNKIKDLPGFPPTFALETFEDYKKNPQLQETAMAVYSQYLLSKYRDPITAAVAFFTGEESEETKAFMVDSKAALAKYGDKKPSTSGKYDNSTIGEYIKGFLRGVNQ